MKYEYTVFDSGSGGQLKFRAESEEDTTLLRKWEDYLHTSDADAITIHINEYLSWGSAIRRHQAEY